MAKYDLSFITPEIQLVQAYHAERMERMFAGEMPREALAICGRWYGSSHGLAGTHSIDMLAQPEEWIADVLADLHAHIEDGADVVTFRPLAVELDVYGVHFIDALFGAKVYFHAGQVWNEELQLPLEKLEKPDLAQSDLFQSVLRLARRVVEATQGRLLLAGPVLSCPINVAINLYGQRLLETLALKPETALRVLAMITHVMRECHEAFATIIPFEQRRNTVVEDRYMPPGYGFIDGCATQLVSARHYNKFFAGFDQGLLGIYPHGGMIHLCGACAQHIPTWREIPELRAVQINDQAVEDLEAYFNNLRRDQILYVAPNPDWPVERILQVTRGQRTVLQTELNQRILL